jgi:hypothetical protein
MSPPAPSLVDESASLNLAADALWIGAGLAAVAAIVLFATTTELEARPSRATTARGRR